ncbi:MAG: RagB/SusD family nutrient uptake outer membrane protein [Chitinophagaceae bacterium]|nr:RagB/SusD family nutrient uptake outer membrane protein [Chitinophagaceae bacterium]MCW5927210.1 RagB/SusD family nutrient uptake outer membrane protein [Chitinophagaceae bacterium]
MNRLIIKLTSIAICYLFMSCDKDYLNKEPIDRPSVASFLKTEGELELAINGAYNKLWYAVDYDLPVEVHLDLASDIGYSRALTNFQFLGNGSVDASNPIILNLWRHYYTGIQRANYILDNVSGISEVKNQARVDQIIAEAKFLRAYLYYHLTEMFGDVPLVTKVLDLEESYMSKNPKAEIADFLLTDLESASQSLPISYTDSREIGRATRGAALTLKSRIALFNNKWEVASEAAKKVIDLSVYNLDADYGSLYLKEKQLESNEIMLMLQYKLGVRTHLGPRWVAPRMASGFAGLIPTQSMIDSYLCTDGLTIDKSPLYNPAQPFLNRDPRLDLSCVVPGSVFNGYQYETHKDSLECWNYNVSPPIRVANQDAINAFASFSGYCWRKYGDMRDPSFLLLSETSIILMRYAEVLLNYAEAKIEANMIDHSVYDAINQVRSRVNMPIVTTGKTQDELRSIIRIERKTELAFEGFRLYDIRRWKIAENVLDGPLYGRIPKGLLSSAPDVDENGTPDYTNVGNRSEMRVIEQRVFNRDRNYLWPIPQFEVDINTNLSQNNGY